MLQEVMENTKKNIQNTTPCVFICQKCNHISRTTEMRCLFCGDKKKSMSHQASSDLTGSPPRKIPRSCPIQVTTPILIVSVGRDGVFDARHSPCVITPNLISCKVKVEGIWILVEIKPSEVEAMLFSEELQIIFFRLRETSRNHLCSSLKVEKHDLVKWLVMVLGNNIQKPSGMNLMVQQLEIFGSTIRHHDGFCKMNYTCDETRKLLLECGLRLPRAEALAAGGSSSNSSSSSEDRQLTLGNSTTNRVNSSSDEHCLNKKARVQPPINHGGLLTSVIKNLSSVGMHLLGGCQATLSLSLKGEGHKKPEKVDDGSSGDDIIILSEEGIDEHQPTSGNDDEQADQQGSLSNTDSMTTSTMSNHTAGGTAEPPIKFEYQPPGSPDSVMITSSDLECLPPGSLVNDTIINFYLKYLYFEQLTDLQRRCTHLFNCFFYSRLAGTLSLTPGGSNNSNGAPANTVTPATTTTAAAAAAVAVPKAGCAKPGQREINIARHASVAKWTRRVDLFTKDYIIIPINENSHWFLGLVCYPWMAGMVSYTALYQAEAFDMCQLTDQFADVDEITFSKDVDDMSILEEAMDRTPSAEASGKAFDRWRRRRLAWLRKCGINAMPCILIFDSLPCQSRVNNLHVIREYLQAEWNSRRASQDGPLLFDKDTIRGFSPRVPCQSNVVDCGIYLLHYVEMFYKKQVQSYTKVFFQNQLTSWFSEASVSQKRSEILALTKRLHASKSTL